MEKTNLWQNALKIRKSIQLQYDRIILEENTSNEVIKRILISLFRKIYNHKNTEIYISIKQGVSPDTCNLIGVKIDGDSGGETDWFYFHDGEFEKHFNEIKEALIKSGIEFSLEGYNSKYNWAILSINLPTMQQLLNSSL